MSNSADDAIDHPVFTTAPGQEPAIFNPEEVSPEGETPNGVETAPHECRYCGHLPCGCGG